MRLLFSSTVTSALIEYTQSSLWVMYKYMTNTRKTRDGASRYIFCVPGTGSDRLWYDHLPTLGCGLDRHIFTNIDIPTCSSVADSCERCLQGVYVVHWRASERFYARAVAMKIKLRLYCRNSDCANGYSLIKRVLRSVKFRITFLRDADCGKEIVNLICQRTWRWIHEYACLATLVIVAQLIYPADVVFSFFFFI